MNAKKQLEEGYNLTPNFDEKGLIPVITSDYQSKDILMFAYMNAESLALSLEYGEAVYYSRSRQEIWHKGKSSGQIQKIIEMRIDCDQDVILMMVTPQGNGGACHVGYRSCFFRKIEQNTETKEWQLTYVEKDKLS